jgi:predicted RNase H-like HicB family nuclease
MFIQWDADDHIYVVTVPELPGCRTHGNTLEEAIKQGEDAIESWLGVDGEEQIQAIPAPKILALLPKSIDIDDEQMRGAA